MQKGVPARAGPVRAQGSRKAPSTRAAGNNSSYCSYHCAPVSRHHRPPPPPFAAPAPAPAPAVVTGNNSSYSRIFISIHDLFTGDIQYLFTHAPMEEGMRGIPSVLVIERPLHM